MKKVLVIIFTLFSIQAFSQTNWCGFDTFRDAFSSDYIIQEQQANRLLFEKANNRLQLNKIQMPVVTLPVVVHVIHQNGPENINDTVITNVIDELNLRFSNSAPFYDSTGTDIQIQFCLATVDPFGNPTNGITRTASPYTDLFSNQYATDLNLKNTIRWEPNLYLNIWVVRSLNSATVAGYANYPVYAGSWIDGIVVRYEYLNGPVLAHEAGHYLGLYHTFEGGCLNENCLLDGDQVCDTPPDFSSDYICPNNSCNTDQNDTTGFSPFLADVNELPNYMDYTNCAVSFSNGQASRMNDALNLYRSTQILSNGCGMNPGGSIPVPSFTYDSIGCPKNAFTNTSINSVGAQWDFDNDGMIDNAGNYVDFQFPSTGTYTVTMYASGYGGIDSITQQVYVQVPPSSSFPIKSVSGLTNSIYLGPVYCLGTTITATGEPGMVSYLWSTGDTTQSITFTPSTPLSLSLTTVDSSGLTWNSCSPVQAGVAPAPIPPTLNVLNNNTELCIGDSLTLLATYSPLALFSIWYANQVILNNYFNTVHQTTTQLFNTYNIIQIDSNGCTFTTPTISFMGDYHALTGNLVQSGDTLKYLNTFNTHHRWYRDGIPVPNSDTTILVPDQTGCYTIKGWYNYEKCGTFSSDSICIIASGLQDEWKDEIIIYPNPTDGLFYIELKENHPINFTVSNSTGQILYSSYSVTPGSVKTKVDISEYKSGVYYLKVFSDKEVMIRKIIRY